MILFQRIVRIVFLMIVLTFSGSGAGQEHVYSASVTLPVPGSLVLPVGSSDNVDLVMIDTYTGNTTIVANGRNIKTPIWNPSGNKIAYHLAKTDAAFYDMANATSQIIETFGGSYAEDFYYPGGWSSDGSNILYEGVIVGSDHNTFNFYLFDANSQSPSLTGLFSLQTNVPLSGIPLPDGLGTVTLANVDKWKRNPVFDEWIALQFSVLDPALQSESATVQTIVNVLWNYDTGQIVSIDQMFDDPISDITLDWSHNGKYLVLSTYDFDNSIQTVHLLSFQPDGEVRVIDSSAISNNRYVKYYMDAGDLLLVFGRDTATNDIVYYAGEIINGTWHETEFLRLDDDIYQTSGPGDWFIRASDEEKKTLSCTFDNTLPTRLEAGNQGRVALVDGSSDDLHIEPGTYTDVITAMTEGTIFTVLSTPECRSGYRWWQIQLADGLTGYVEEASADTYWLEPVK